MRYAALLLTTLFLVACSIRRLPSAEQTPTPAEIEYYDALTRLNQGDWKGARAGLERSVALDPSLAEAWNDLAYVIPRADGPDSHAQPPSADRADSPAVTAARTALALKPDLPAAQYRLGFALLVDGRYADAVTPLRHAADLEPDRPEPRTALGLALLGLGSVDAAIAACREAEQIRPGFRWATECQVRAGSGFTRLPAGEAAVGKYRYVAGQGFAPAGGEFRQIGRPFACHFVTDDGWRSTFIGCDPRGGWFFSWQASRRATGTTPAGVGVGTRWSKVLEVYGDTYRSANGLHYAVADLHMIVEGNEKDGVTTVSFHIISPFWTIESWLHDPVR